MTEQTIYFHIGFPRIHMFCFIFSKASTKFFENPLNKIQTKQFRFNFLFFIIYPIYFSLLFLCSKDKQNNKMKHFSFKLFFRRIQTMLFSCFIKQIPWKKVILCVKDQIFLRQRILYLHKFSIPLNFLSVFFFG